MSDITDGEILETIQDVVLDYGLCMARVCIPQICETVAYAHNMQGDEDFEERTRLLADDFIRHEEEMKTE